MIQGFTLPRTPKGKASLVQAPPWHYVGNIVAIEFEADPEKIKGYLPEPLELDSTRCCVYFADWQSASENGQEYLDPVESQYRETIVLMSARCQGEAYAYCPYIWVDQDKALLRGLIQGWPKQIGETHLSRSFSLASKAAPKGVFGTTLSVYGKRMLEGVVRINGQSEALPSPTFAGSLLMRYFPDLRKGCHDQPLVHDLVRLKSRDVEVSEVETGNADLRFMVPEGHELMDFTPLRVLKGYRFEVKLTVDDLEWVQALK
jgi:acetoacetate decarboxylase